MSLLFVYEAKFKEDKRGNYYIDGSINRDFWKRYIKLDPELNIISLLDTKKYDRKTAKLKFNEFNNSNKKLIPIPNLYSSISAFINPRIRSRVNKTIEDNVMKNDLIVARVPCNAGYKAVIYAKKHKKPYLIEVVGCPWDALWNHSFKGKLLAPLNYLSMKMCISQAQYVIYVTNEFLQRRYPCKGKTVGCSDVMLPSLDRNILDVRINKIKKMTKNRPILLGTTAAVNVRYKGQEYVIEAISKLKKEGYNFEYNLVGGGDISYLKSISEKYNIANKVKFWGSLPHEKIFEYLDDIDIYIQPSKTEGLPRALVEAMSRGCPLIGSDAGGIPELINNEFIFHNGSVDEICKLLKTINKNAMIIDAKRNFEKAKEYDKNILDIKRINFYKDFSENIGESNG